jgi:hypothetical protein
VSIAFIADVLPTRKFAAAGIRLQQESEWESAVVRHFPADPGRAL